MFGSLIKTILLVVNAIAILNDKRFIKKCTKEVSSRLRRRSFQSSHSSRLSTHQQWAAHHANTHATHLRHMQLEHQCRPADTAQHNHHTPRAVQLKLHTYVITALFNTSVDIFVVTTESAMRASRSAMSMTAYSSTLPTSRTILIQQGRAERKKKVSESPVKGELPASHKPSSIRQLLSIEVSKHSKSASKTIPSRSIVESPHKTLKTPREQVDIPDPVIRHSKKSYSPVMAYAASTHHGLYRLVNEDKISIILSNRCMFGLFDGYNGSMASEFLKEKLLADILKNTDKKNVQIMLRETMQNYDELLVKQQIQSKDKSGSSALVCLIQNRILYVANVGTSRAFGKHAGTGRLVQLAHSHDCNNMSEYARIAAIGGRFYRTKITLKSSAATFVEGPLRIHPLGLTVTRTMGNYQAKQQNRAQSRNMVLSTPQIKYMRIEQLDWVMMCSEGLLEVITEQRILEVCNSTERQLIGHSQHEFAEKCVQRVMKLALKNRCAENATAIMIILKIGEDEPPFNQIYITGHTSQKKPSVSIGASRSTRPEP